MSSGCPQVVAGSRSGDKVQPAAQFYLQFVTRYLHEGGQWRCRITTVTRGSVPRPPASLSTTITARCCRSLAAAFLAPCQSVIHYALRSQYFTMGTTRVRGCAAHRWTDASIPGDLISGFDQEAAAVITARLATFKMETVTLLPLPRFRALTAATRVFFRDESSAHSLQEFADASASLENRSCGAEGLGFRV